MMVREAAKPETFRNRSVAPGAQVIVSPWHMGRNAHIWPDPHGFRPERWGRTAPARRPATGISRFPPARACAPARGSPWPKRC